MSKPQLIHGTLFTDTRGTLRFVNPFNCTHIKRFYQITNASTKIIRAFHGHKHEEKYAYVVTGSILICAVPLNTMIHPSKKLHIYKYVLTDKKPTILHIPPRYANGFQALEPHTNVIFFSTTTLAASKKDDYRYSFDYWGTNIWKHKRKP